MKGSLLLEKVSRPRERRKKDGHADDIDAAGREGVSEHNPASASQRLPVAESPWPYLPMRPIVRGERLSQAAVVEGAAPNPANGKIRQVDRAEGAPRRTVDTNLNPAPCCVSAGVTRARPALHV
jgi:hypothetical protein